VRDEDSLVALAHCAAAPPLRPTDQRIHTPAWPSRQGTSR